MPIAIVGEEDRATVGRYHAEHVRPSRDEQPQEEVQGMLDVAEEKEWYLVGAVGGLPDGGTVHFWDTKWPSFGRNTR
jgi:hypothetical protein